MKKKPTDTPKQREKLEIDHQLAMELKGRKRGILRRIYDAYASRLRQVIWPVLHDHAETEDVVQDVLLYADRKSEQFDSARGGLFGWLSTIARRRAIDRLRQRKAQQRMKDGFEAEQRQAIDLVTEHESQVARMANCRDLRHIFADLLSRLPPAQEKVIRMKFYDYMSQRQIAAKLDTSPSTVRTRIELGMQKLKGSVESMGSAIA